MTRVICNLLLCLCTVISQTVLAQEYASDCPSKPKNDAAAQELAGTWFARGEKLVAEQRDQEALAAFNCSLRMVAHPATLFNAGQAARLVGKTTQALSLLRRYLELSPQGRMSDKARVFILELESDQKEKQKQDALQAPPEPMGQAQVEADRVDVAGLKNDAADRRKTLITAGYVSVSVGGATIITGTVLQILAGKIALSDAKETDDYEEYKSLDNDRKSYQIGAVVCFAVGTVALGAGLAMMMVAKKEEKEKSKGVRISLFPGPGSLSIVGRF
jgi:tetratricopeptide (TPR) repeat protein